MRFSARGTWLLFESGNSSLQGAASASVLASSSPRGFAAFDAELGASRYEGFAHFAHALARARLGRIPIGTGTGWFTATLGSVGSDAGQVFVQGAMAYRLDGQAVALSLSATGTAVGNISYADLEAAIAHGRPGGPGATAVLGARVGDPEGNAGPYLEATVTLPVSRNVAVVLGGGRFATDLVRGNVAGRYVSAALRLATPARRPAPLPPSRGEAAPGAATVSATLTGLRCTRGRSCTLRVRASASQVEIMGDFTDWLPVLLERAEPGVWTLTLTIPPGRHRLNLRLDGGPWGIPVGVTPVADDFQGLVGTVVIP